MSMKFLKSNNSNEFDTIHMRMSWEAEWERERQGGKEELEEEQSWLNEGQSLLTAIDNQTHPGMLFILLVIPLKLPFCLIHPIKKNGLLH